VRSPLVLIADATAREIAASQDNWGVLALTEEARDRVFSVVAWSNALRTMRPSVEGWRQGGVTRRIGGADSQALWYRGTTELHHRARFDAIRGQATPVSFLQEQVSGNWLAFKRAVLVVTFVEGEDDTTEWAAWLREGEDVFTPLDLEIFDPGADLLAPLDVAWPRSELADRLLTVVGLGSVGGAACEALAAYGFANFALIDHDRLEAHNFARHRATRSAHGTYKVDAVADLLKARMGDGIRVEPIVAHVGEDAHRIRPFVGESSLVACFADGPEARRVAAHLAFWARKPVLLACVLGFGAYGEVLRLIPGRTGCLECNRAAMAHSFTIERELETVELRERLEAPRAGGHVGLSRGLGHYAVERTGPPTTAVPGDLHLVAGLAAKAITATLLERAGYREQRLPGDHALIGLRPSVEEVEPPFDGVDRVGKIAWKTTATPRADCTTCGPASTL
jgi:hypothetical protein